MTEQEINIRIAEDNKVIKLQEETVETPIVKYYEVVKTSCSSEILFYGNNPKLKEGDLFECSNSLQSNVLGVSKWLLPNHLEFSGLNSIALECCQELTEMEYKQKLARRD
ncbi:gp218 [Sphingomonas phage PAU]|uniref:gp218 n=1 Tax=Sphingomonas phage PAU TaxID=1150991 RepID=UPI0002573378|nr:gp218 [Sphingomonas phage PAU]AFF28216.1 gp218 [Sphingomonas phage PAU]